MNVDEELIKLGWSPENHQYLEWASIAPLKELHRAVVCWLVLLLFLIYFVSERMGEREKHQ